MSTETLPSALALAFVGLRPDQYRPDRDRADTAYLVIAAITVGLIGLSATPGLLTEGGWPIENAENVLLVMVLSTGFTLAFSRWVTRIIGQSAERSEPIGQLEATRAKLGEAHHLQGSRSSGSGWPGRSTTPWPRVTPASSCSPRWPGPRWRRTGPANWPSGSN